MICLFLWTSVAVLGQKSSLHSQLKEEAESFFEAGDYSIAALYFDSLLMFHPNDPSYAYYAGFSRFHLRTQRSAALPLLMKSAKLNFDRAYLPLAILLHEEGRLVEAEEYYTKAKTVALKDQEAELNVRFAQFENAKVAKSAAEAISVFRLPDEVNSAYIEHTPFVTFNDSTLLFTSRRPIRKNAIQDFNGEFDENVLVSTRTADGWSAATPLPGNVNGPLNDAIASLSTDEEEIIVFKTTRNLRSSELWLAENEGEKGWRLNGRLKEPMNSDFVQSGIAVSSDATTFIVSSDRPGGFGGMDLYRVVRFGNGDYSKPVNLGPTINSAQDEIAPYFLADGKTLFFSSNRMESIGGYDMFRCDWKDDHWESPKNMGYPLNTFRDDLQLSVSPKGGVCYFSRAEVDNAADYNLFRANLPGFNMEANILRGEIRDATTGLLVTGAELTMFSSDFAEVKAIYPCKGGRFFIVLLPGESGVLELLAPGYQDYQEEINYSDHQGIWESRMQIMLHKTE